MSIRNASSCSGQYWLHTDVSGFVLRSLMYPSSSSEVATDEVMLLFRDRYPWGVCIVWSMGVEGSDDCEVLESVRPRAAPPHDWGLGELPCRLIWRLGRVVFMLEGLEGLEELGEVVKGDILTGKILTKWGNSSK